MSILTGPMGLDESSGVLKALRGYLRPLKKSIGVQNKHYCSVASEFSSVLQQDLTTQRDGVIWG